MWLQSGTYLTWQVTLNKLASPHYYQTSEAVQIQTPRGTDVFAAGPAVETSWKNVWTKHHWHHPVSKNVKMLCNLQLKGCKCSFTDRYRQRVQAQGASHEQGWRHCGWTGTPSHGSVPFLTGRFHTAFKHFFEPGRSHRFHFDLLHLHLLLLHLLLLASLSCLLKKQKMSGFTLSCSVLAQKGLILLREQGLMSDLHTTLPLWILLIHDPLFLSPLLLLPAGLGCLLPLGVRLFQEVLLHASSVLVGLLFALNAGRRT